MTDQMKFYLSDFYRNEPGVKEEAIVRFEEENKFSLPADYAAVMKEFNGGDGFIAEGGLTLFPIEELKEVNYDYFGQYPPEPDYFIIGKDAAVTGIGFHKHNKTYHVFALTIDFSSPDEFDFSGNSFEEVLTFLYHQWGNPNWTG